MRQSAWNSFHDALGLLRVFWQIGSQSIQNVDNPPLIAVIHSSQQLLSESLVEFEQRLSFELTANGQRNQRIGYDSGVSIIEQILKQFQKALVLHDLGCDFKHLGDT